ncbi:MAG: methyltransferase domain-containing protein [Dehalococcoidia bacterium]
MNIDCGDAEETARFYTRFLGWEISYRDADFILLRDPGGGTGLSFQARADYRPPVWPEQPDGHDRMLHLDIRVDDLGAAVADALSWDARLAACRGREDLRVTLDPAGHPFCLFTREARGVRGRPAARPDSDSLDAGGPERRGSRPGTARPRSAIRAGKRGCMDATEIDRLAHFEEWYWWHRARASIVTDVLRRYAPAGNNDILDVGCGAGNTSLALREFGTVFGVDASCEAAAVAHRRGLASASMDATQLALRDDGFDVAVALDVLEHLDDDLAAARELRRVLRPRGLLLVSVPAYQWLWSSHDVALHHRRRYTRRQLSGVLERAGFALELASYAMSLALLPAAAVRLLERLRPAGVAEGEHVSGYVSVSPLTNAVLSRLVALDRHAIGRLPIPGGLSVIAVARKVV